MGTLTELSETRDEYFRVAATPRNLDHPRNADQYFFYFGHLPYKRACSYLHATSDTSTNLSFHYKTVVGVALSMGACLAGVRVTDTNIEAGRSCGLMPGLG